jgi:flagellar assembly protein FliH
MTARHLNVGLIEPLLDVQLAGREAATSQTSDGSEEREQAAYERGRADGEKALSAQLVQQRTELKTLEEGVLAALRQVVPQVARESEQALVALALEVAQKLVAGLPVSFEMVEAAIREALARVEESTDCHLYLHPEDWELLQQFNSALLVASPQPPRLHFHRATEVTRGGCLVKTHFGVIDGRRETKMELLRKSVLA